MKRLIRRLRVARWSRRYPVHHSNPNFLFSTWPLVEWGEVPTVTIKPSGTDDTARMQAAADRLGAIGGGVLQFRPGIFHVDNPFYIQ